MASVRKPVLISKRSAIDAILVLCSKVIKTFPECEVQATVSMLSKDSFTHNYKSELSKKEKEGEKNLLRQKNSWRIMVKRLRQEEWMLGFKVLKKVPKCMEDEEIEAMMDPNVNHIS